MQKPLVSAIIPVYNTGKFLRKCVDSVVGQTFSDWETVIVDDGSTDSFTIQETERLASSDARIRLLRTPNGGLSAARNRGLEIAEGKWIVFIDSDDSIHPRFMEYLLDAAQSSGTEIAGCVHREVESQPDCFEDYSFPGSLLMGSRDCVRRILYQNCVITNSAWGYIYSSDLFKNIRFREGIYYEDLDIFYKLMLATERIAIVDLPMYYYTQHPASYIHTFNLRRSVVLDVTSEISRYMNENLPELLPAAHSREVSASFNILKLMRANGASDPEIRRRCKATIRKYRRESLLDPQVRFKNKAALAATYIGLLGLL